MFSSQSKPKLFDINSFLQEILFSAEERGDLGTVLKVLISIEKQVISWLELKPSENEAQYALTVMHAIISAYDLPRSAEYHPIKARIAYMRGLIHEQGFLSIPKHPKQAEIDFKDAISYGFKVANVKVGDIYFQRIKENQPPYSKHPLFNEMVRIYSEGDDAAKVKLIQHGLFIQYQDALFAGNFTEAKKIVKEIYNLIDLNPDLPIPNELRQNISIAKKTVNEIDNLANAIDDAKKITKKFIEMIDDKNIPLELLEKEFLKVVDQLKNTKLPNPVFDYYYACLLLKTSKAIPTNRIKAQTFFDNILKSNNYPIFFTPLLNYVKGLGIEETFFNLPSSSKEYFESAQKGGCYLANSWLGNYFELVEQDYEKAKYYYSLSIFTDDVRAQITYQRFLSHLLTIAIKENDKEKIINLAEESLNVLKLLLDNPLRISVQADFIIDQMQKNQDLLDRYVNKPKVLLAETWNTNNQPELFSLREKIAAYEATNLVQYSVRLKLLQEIQRLSIKLLSENKLKEENSALIRELLETLNDVLDYVGRKKYLHELNIIINKTPKERLRDFLTYLKTPGHMGDKYYLEYLDPLHRKPELISQWNSSNTTRNYFSWLANFDSYATHTERVIYLDENERKQFQAHIINNHLHCNGKPLANGNYLFAIDPSLQLYIASELGESKGLVHFHHSSFLSGGSTKCAGEVTITNGKISKISNYSGHYMPSITRLYKMIMSLRAANLLSEDFKIGVVGMPLPDDFTGNSANLTLNEFRALYFRLLLSKQKSEKTVTVKKNSSQQPSANFHNESDKTKELMQRFLAAETAIKSRMETIRQADWGSSFMYQSIEIKPQTTIKVPRHIAEEWKLLQYAVRTGDWMLPFNNNPSKDLLFELENLTSPNLYYKKFQK